MKEFKGKTAFITGGASGIGFGMARAFGRAGMNVVIADIEDVAPRRLERLSRADQGWWPCIATSASEVLRAARSKPSRFRQGPCRLQQCGRRRRRRAWHGRRSRLGLDHRRQSEGRRLRRRDLSAADQEPWRRRPFRQHRLHGGPYRRPGMEPYTATKYAVVAMSEGWARPACGQQDRCPFSAPASSARESTKAAARRQDRYGGVEEGALDPQRRDHDAQAICNRHRSRHRRRARAGGGARRRTLYLHRIRAIEDSWRAASPLIRAGFDQAANTQALKGVKNWAPIFAAALQQQ